LELLDPLDPLELLEEPDPLELLLEELEDFDGVDVFVA
jgi:hypothetical protein